MSSQSSTFSSGGSPTAAQVNGWAQGTLGYVQVTADQGSITVETDLTSLTLTITVVAGRRIKITGRCYMQNTGTVGSNILKIFSDGIQVMEVATAVTVANSAEFLHVESVLTPSAGSHTWKLRAQASAGTSTMKAAAPYPAFILVEDIGAV